MLEFIYENLTEIGLVILVFANFSNYLQIIKLKNQVQFLQFTTIRGESDESQNRHEEGA